METDDNISNSSLTVDLDDCKVYELSEDAGRHEIELENKRLTQLNKNLQESLTALKVQLKEALNAADTSKSVNDQVVSLKSQLIEANEKNEQVIKEYRDYQGEKEFEFKRLQTELQKLKAERDDALAAFNSSEEHISKLKKDKQQLRNENEEKMQLLESITEDFQKVKCQKKKTNQKFITVAERLQQAEATNEQLGIAIQQLQNERDSLLQDNEALALKLGTATAFNNESEASLNSLAKEINSKSQVIDALQQQLEQQRKEIEEFSSSRQAMLTLLQSIQHNFCVAENIIESHQKEIAALKLKAKNQSKSKNEFATIQGFQTLTFPFEGELRDKFETILKLPQYQPFQKIQLILNDSAQIISDLNSRLTEVTRKHDIAVRELKEFTLDQTKYREILEALLCDLKNLATNQEIINGSVLCRSDPVFIEFINKKLTEFNQIVQREAIKDPKYIPTDFFITSDITKRKEAVIKLLEPADSTFALFTAQFLTNVFLQNQLACVTEPLKQLEDITKTGDLKGTRINDIPKLMAQMKETIAKLRSSRRQIHTALKKSQQSYRDLAKTDAENRSKISQLQLENETLFNEADVLKVKLQVANNELLLKSNERGNLSVFANQIREGVEEQQQDQLMRCHKLEEALQQKTSECAELSELIGRLQESLDVSNRQTERRARKNEEALLEQIERLQIQLDEAEVRLFEKKKKAKRNEKALREQYEASIRELTAGYNESKASLEATISSLKEKATQAREMSKKLVDSMSDVEKRSQVIQEENTSLLNNQRQLQLQLSTMKQQITKDKQAQQAQLSAQIMACESRAQKASATIRSEFESQKRDILALAQVTLGKFYNIEPDEFDEDTYKSVLHHARDDLEKLAYFQSEATKPHCFKE